MEKTYDENEYVDAYIDGDNDVVIGEDAFPVDVTQLVEGGVLQEDGTVLCPATKKVYDFRKEAKVVAVVALEKVVLSDDLSQGHSSGEILSAVWIGDHYQYHVRTNDEEDFICNSPYSWNEGDLVSIEVAKEDIKLRLKGSLDAYEVEE